MGVIIFNGKSSLDYGIQVWQAPDYEMPERDYEIVHVPGRNGDIVIDKGSYKNVTRSYTISGGSLEEKFLPKAISISEWLHSASGYAVLEDSYEPEYYRLAMYKDAGTITNVYRKAGVISISFDCKPQRFLKLGDEAISISNRRSLRNPTEFQSLPIIKVYGDGDGVLSVGNYDVIISSINQTITIDSEIQDAYNGIFNLNSSIELTNGFPKLVSGENDISFSGGITSVEVIPKWWTL